MSRFIVNEESDEAKIIPLLGFLEDPPSPIDQLNSNQILTLSGSEEKDLEFVDKTKHLRFPSLKKLTLWHLALSNSRHEAKIANEWLSNAFYYNLKYFEIDSGFRRIDLSKYRGGLQNVLSLVTHQIYIARFKIDVDTLKQIFERGHQARCLVFYNCKIDSLDGFHLNPSLNYRIRELDLYLTCRKAEKRFVSQYKLRKFVKALSRTNLKHSLTYVHVTESEFPQNEVQQIFDEFGFELTVHGDNECPLILEA